MERFRIAVFCVICALCLVATGPARAEEGATDSEETGIRAAIQRYLDGTSYSKPDLIRSAFYEEAELFLSHPEHEIFLRSIAEYADGFERQEYGTFNGREGEILSVDRTNDLATATAEIRLPSGARYIDLFLLKKLSGGWKIISKAATRVE